MARSPRRPVRDSSSLGAVDADPAQTSNSWNGSPPTSPMTRTATRSSPRDGPTTNQPATPTTRRRTKAWPHRGWIGAGGGRDRSDSVVSRTDSEFDEPPSPSRPDRDEGILNTTMDVLVEIVWYWVGWLGRWLLPQWVVRAADNRALFAAATYQEWRIKAAEIDRKNQTRQWKMQFESDDYDYVLIHERLKELQKARHRNDWARSAFMLRSLDRNLGGIGSPKLFEPCILGTKEVIEQYLNEVEYHLNYLADHTVPGLTPRQKVDMFVHIRQGFGRSALLLSGGAGLGVHHFGVIKVLWEHGLLPRVVSGSSAGALVGALICTASDSELDQLLDGSAPAFKSTNLITRVGEGDAPTMSEMLYNLGTRGALADVNVLRDCCRVNFGDMTFQEAYDKTHRILNITVNSRAAHGQPRLLNYLTSPNVVIWSASCASCALSGVFNEVEIMCKDTSGRLTPWGGPPGTKWSDGSIESDLPIERLRELFNVNHFIVSQVNPHVVPMLMSERPHVEPRFPWLVSVFLSEFQYRLGQLSAIGIFPATSRQMLGMLTQKYTGDVTIVPYINHRAYIDILSNPTPPIYRRAVLGGERAAWARLPIIKSHCQIEVTLERIVEKLRGLEQWTMT
eukprot:m.78131 g.78131  ORF g.78131 m.78131 type:complete len:622 (+) comp9198_c0_seq1:346-2211(+)